MASNLPRFIVIESVDKIGYLTYIREGGKADGYLRFMEPQVTSPYAKFEVESSKTRGLVHIRSCQNNKYWQRTYLPSVPSGPWIVTTSKEKEEDESKESCTLFKFVSVDTAMNTFRIMHIQSGCYVWSWRLEDPKFDHGLMSNNKEFGRQRADEFTIIDWSLLLILPRYVAFKGDNDMYMYLYRNNFPCFAQTDVGESTVACEIVPANDGNIRIKSPETGKFYRCDSKWIWADTDDTTADNMETLFRPVKLGDDKIALISLRNNNFCKRLSEGSTGNGVAAVVHSVTKEAQITVEEHILSRQIYDVKYDLDNARVYNETVIVVDQNSASNFTEKESSMDVKLVNKDAKSSSWKTDFSLTLGMKASMDISVPLIFEGSIEMSAEVKTGIELGKVFESSTEVEVLHKVVVPPMSKVTVDLIATKGMCDVPFTYMQRDTLYDGSSVLTEVQGGTYYGSNYYRKKFEARSEQLPPGSKR
ncbi:hypothetical protein F3Y22_tig00111427pilonHSYRG00492 [Hibiscus syriacus]|uniref:Agglutinin domain-containing protein n=1 Tax=Hibiscus syriacus TaxID=106335 RepID=A0A6A2XPG5_HIBSY|nr:uncharacterized protein LOC120163150 [Hibiscus syriacus]KAE8678331.1 hypothetical protein F3Y22_tig00111427pilonHSYRG00492 [Hibiscus syriacus]